MAFELDDGYIGRFGGFGEGSARAELETIHEHSRRMTQDVVEAVEVVGAGSFFAWWQGRRGGSLPVVAGISADLGAGLLLLGLGIASDAGMLGKSMEGEDGYTGMTIGRHMTNAGLGALTWWGGNYFHNMGNDAFQAEQAAASGAAPATPAATQGWNYGNQLGQGVPMHNQVAQGIYGSR